MTLTLPSRPSLARLRAQARALQRSCRAAEPVALARLAAVFPERPQPAPPSRRPRPSSRANTASPAGRS